MRLRLVAGNTPAPAASCHTHTDCCVFGFVIEFSSLRPRLDHPRRHTAARRHHSLQVAVPHFAVEGINLLCRQPRLTELGSARKSASWISSCA